MSAERLLVLACVLLLAACGACSDKASQAPKSPLNEISALYTSGAVDEAVTRLRTHLQTEPRDEVAWTILGHALLDQNKLDEAEAAYAKALEIDPRRIEAITGQGRLHRMRQQYTQAMIAYQRAIAIDASYAQAWSSMSVVSLKQGNIDQAITQGEKAYALDNANPLIAANLAIAYHYAGNTQKRDELAQAAKKLGYKAMDRLDRIFAGEIEVRD